MSSNQELSVEVGETAYFLGWCLRFLSVHLYLKQLYLRTSNQEFFFDLMHFSSIAPLKTQILKKKIIHFQTLIL